MTEPPNQVEPLQPLQPEINPPQPRIPPSRLTVVEQVSFQSRTELPKVVTARFSRPLATDEQPWERKQTAGPEWAALDAGWFLGLPCGMLTIENLEGLFLQVYPTPAERADIEARVIELSFGGGNAAVEVRPGESCRFHPSDVSSIHLRCRQGKARVQVTVFPS